MSKKLVEGIMRAMKQKGLKQAYIELVLWHGDVVECDDAIYNEILVYSDSSNKAETIYQEYYGPDYLEDNEDNVKKLLKGQATKHRQLSKVFDHVISKELSV